MSKIPSATIFYRELIGGKGPPHLPNGANGIVIDSKEVIAPLYDAVKTRTGAMASTNNL